MLPTHHLRHLLPFLFLFLLAISGRSQVAAQEEEEQPFAVGAKVTAVEEGGTAELQCSNAHSEKMDWFKGDDTSTGTPISHNASSRVHANTTTGLLTVREARLSDTGVYLCVNLTDQSHNITTELHVYEMPDYLQEGMITFGVSAGLLLVLVGCSLHTYTRNRERKAAEDKARLHKTAKVRRVEEVRTLEMEF